MTTKTKIDLTPFCGGKFSKPWNHGGWTCATNGYVAVRVRTHEPDDELPVRSISGPLDMNAEPFWATLANIAIWEPFPAECEGVPFPYEENQPCERCREWDECNECDGDGTLTCEHCDSDYDCKGCGGSGGRWNHRSGNCPICNNTRTATKYVRLGGKMFNRNMVYELSQLPNAVYAVDGDYLFAKFDGGEAVLIFATDYGV